MFGPFDERDGAVEVGLEVAPLLGIDAGKPVQIEVRNCRRRPVPWLS